MTDLEAYGMDKKPGDSRKGAGEKKPTGTSTSRGVASYWQGIVETALRAVALFFVVLSIITAAIVVGLVNDLSSCAQDYIKDSDDHHDDNSEVPDTPQLLALTRAEGYFLIGFAFVVIFYEAVVIVLRCCNCSLWIRLFLIVDTIITGILAVIYLVTGEVASRYSSLWDDWVEFAQENKEVSERLESSDIDNGKNIRGALGATCAFCLLEMVVLIGIAGWLLVSVCLKWYLRPQKT